MDQLRTETAQALLGEYHNLNGYIASMCLSKFVEDPEYFLIKKAILEARAFLAFASDELQKQFFNAVAKYRGLPAQAIGPASALNLYLAKVAWQCDKTGTLHTDGFYKLHLVTSNLDTITTALEESWMEHISHMVSRQGLRNMPMINRTKTLRTFATLPEKQQKCIALEMVGCHMLAKQKSHFVENHTDQCSLCGKTETHRHDLLECDATQETRSQFPNVCSRLEEQDPVRMLAPFVFQQPVLSMHRLIHQQMVEGEVSWTEHLPTTYFFSDGSCQQPQCVDTRWATYSLVTPAVTIDKIVNLPDMPIADILEKFFRVITVSHVAGTQTIPRAELFAAVKFFENCSGEQNLYTDSAYVIASVNLVWQTVDIRILHQKKNFDLLARLHVTLRSHTSAPKVFKVKSHQDIGKAEGFERFLRIGNAVADEAAKRVAQETGRPLTEEKQKLHKDFNTQICHLTEEYEMRYALARARVAIQKHQTELEETKEVPVTGLQRLQGWTITEPQTYPISDDHRVAAEASRWGVAYTSLIYVWLTSLKWPPQHVTDDGVGITWYELAVNFWLTTQQAPRLNLAKGNEPPHIVNIVEHPAYDATHYTFAKMIFAVEHAAYVYGSSILPLNKRVKAKSLFQLGAMVHRQGLPVRPEMSKQSETLAIIDTYIQQNKMGNNIQFHALPSIPECEPLYRARYDNIEGDNFQKWQARYTRRKKFLRFG